MDQKTLGTDAPPPYYDYGNPTSQTYGSEKTTSQTFNGTVLPPTPGSSSSTPTQNDASGPTPAIKLKVGKTSVVERNYNIWSPNDSVLYTVERHDRIFSSKPELYLRHRSGTEIAGIHLRTAGAIQFSMHGAHYEAKPTNALVRCWTIDRDGEKYEVRHTQTGVSARSTKHLKLVDSQDRMVARFISHLSRSMHTLGKVELFGEGVGVAEVQLLETGGAKAQWQEWCLALLVGIAEKEKRRDQAAAAGGG